MKKSFMTRVLATGLSVAMAFSLSTATNLVSAQAASKPVLVDYTTGGSGKTMTVNVGDTAKIKVNKATKKNYKIASVKVSSNKIRAAKNKAGTVVTVRGVTATEEGKPAAIKVSFTAKKTGKASKYSFASKVTVVDKEPVVEALAISSVAQKKASAIEVTFNKEMTEVKPSEFSVVRADDVVRTVKSATISATDKKVVTVEVYESLTDAKDYKVTYKPATGDAVEATFTATAGTPAEITLSTATVTANVATEIKYVVKDAKGIELSTAKIGSLPNNIELSKKFSAEATDYLDGDKLMLKEVGNTAELTFKYRTYSYDKDGNETGAFSSVCKVEAVADTSTVDAFQYGVAGSKPNFDKDTLKDWLALGDTNKKVFFRIKDSNNADVTSTIGYTVESNDPSIILVAGDVKDGAELTTVKAGTAVLVLKNDKGETVKTLPITVKAQRKLSTFNLSQSSVRIATNAALSSVASQTIDVVAKDQYGDDMTLSDLTATCAKNDQTTVKEDAAKKTLEIGTTGETNKGDYRYTVKATAKNSDDGTTSIEKTLTVTAVSTTDTTAKRVLVVEDQTASRVKSTIDTTITKDNQAGNKVAIVLAEQKNGVIINKVSDADVQANTVSAITVTKVGTGVIAQTGAGLKAVTCDAIDTTALVTNAFDKLSDTSSGTNADLVITASDKSGSTITKNLGAGTYRVTYKFYNGKTASVDFTIKDTQAAVTAKVLKTSYEGSVKTDLINDKDYIVYYVGDRKSVV